MIIFKALTRKKSTFFVKRLIQCFDMKQASGEYLSYLKDPASPFKRSDSALQQHERRLDNICACEQVPRLSGFIRRNHKSAGNHY